MKKIILLIVASLLLNYCLLGTAPHILPSVTEVLTTPTPPESQASGTNVWAILTFIFGIMSLIPYLNGLALGGYLPALFHRLAKKKMAEKGPQKGDKLLKSGKIMTIVGFSMYSVVVGGLLIAVIVGASIPGIILPLAVMGVWGFFKLLGK